MKFKHLYFIALIFMFLGCTESLNSGQVNISNPDYLYVQGTWKQKETNNKILIKKDSIIQTIGLPIIVGDRISYTRTGNILYCKYTNFLISADKDSFKLDILKLNNNELKFRMVFWGGFEYDLNFVN